VCSDPTAERRPDARFDFQRAESAGRARISMSGSSDEPKNGNNAFTAARESKHPGLKSKFSYLQERQAPIDPLLTIDELCDLLKVEPRTIYQLTYRGKIPHYKITNRLRFRQSEILSWIEEQRVTKPMPFEQGE